MNKNHIEIYNEGQTPFKTATKNIKYLGINLGRSVRKLYEKKQNKTTITPKRYKSRLGDVERYCLVFV